MRAMRPALPLFASLLVCVGARASPDSEYSSMQLSPLCTSEEKIVFLMSAESSRGTSFTKVFEWLWVTVDLKTGEWALDPEADLTASKDPEASPPQATMQTAKGEGRRLADVLARSKADHCGRLVHGGGADPYGYGTQFRYSTLGSEFLIHFAERQRSVQAIGARPSTLEWSYERSPMLAVSTPAPVGKKGAPRPSLPAPPSNASRWKPVSKGLSCRDADAVGAVCQFLPEYEFQVADKTVFVFAATDDAYNAQHLVFAVPTERLNQQRAQLLNAAGYDHHMNKNFAKAQSYFFTALQFDGENSTARYNAACANARQRKVADAVDSLERLRSQPGLKKKIARDADFDDIREAKAFQAFFSSLPD